MYLKILYRSVFMKKRLFSLITFGLCLIVFVGCATYPMGLSKEEWNALSLEQQADLRAEQFRINEARRIQREAEARERAERQAAIEHARQERIQELRENARFGDIVTVVLRGGSMNFDGRRYACEPQAFDLVKGEFKDIEIIGRYQSGNNIRTVRESWKVRFSEDGNTLYLNETPFEHTMILVNSGSWDEGVTVSLAAQGQVRSGEVLLRDMTASIRYKNLPGMPTRLIIDRR